MEGGGCGLFELLETAATDQLGDPLGLAYQAETFRIAGGDDIRLNLTQTTQAALLGDSNPCPVFDKTAPVLGEVVQGDLHTGPLGAERNKTGNRKDPVGVSQENGSGPQSSIPRPPVGEHP